MSNKLQEERQSYHILLYITLLFHQLCSMRILPHHQDTGGFFVAVLEKIALLPWENKTCTLSQSVQNVGDKNELSLEEEALRDAKLLQSGKRILEEEKKSRDSQRKRRKIVGYREDPFVFFKDETEDVWQSIK